MRPHTPSVEPRLHQTSHPPNRPVGLRVAYVMSRFPKLTETFVLYEMLEMEAAGNQVDIFPLLRERQSVIHGDAEKLIRRANYCPFLSIPILGSLLYFLRRRPGKLFKTLIEVLKGTLGSARYFAGALIFFPKSVHFARKMEENRVDHIHAHFANHPAVVALIIHRLTGIPFSFTAHGSDLHVDRHMLRQKVVAAKFVVTVSRYNREILISESGEQYRNKIRVIHCGVDLVAFKARPKVEGRPLQIVCVASLEEVKGHKYLIEACLKLRSRKIPFQCHIAGDGPLEKVIARQIDGLNLNDSIYMHGALPRVEVAGLLADADVAVLASFLTRDGRREGIPVVLMEAMASGLPVVASDLSGIPELVDSGLTGILVPPQDPEAIADALETLARDVDLRVSMGRAGREKVMQEFNLRKSTLQLLECFRSSIPPAAKMEAVDSSRVVEERHQVHALPRAH